MAERGWTLQQVKDSIEQRKPDFAAYVAPQMEYSDVVISVLPSDISKEEVGMRHNNCIHYILQTLTHF